MEGGVQKSLGEDLMLKFDFYFNDLVIAPRGMDMKLKEDQGTLGHRDKKGVFNLTSIAILNNIAH